MVSNLTLKSHQVEHAQKIKNSLEENHFAFDFSPLGSGKTFCSAYIAESGDYDRIIVIAPLSVTIKWESLAKSIRSTNKKVHIMTWSKLRNNNLFLKKCPVTKKEFWCTPEYQKMLKNEKILVIADEIQNVKNKSNQSESLKELLRRINFKSDNNYLHFLGISGSPFDKKEQVERLFGIIWYTKGQPLKHWSLADQTMYYPGLVTLLKRLNLPIRIPDKKDYKNMIWEIFTKHFVPKYAFEMELPVPKTTPIKLDIYNYYATLSENSISEMESYMENLQKTIQIISEGKSTLRVLHQITKILMKIEILKIESFVRILEKTLSKNTNTKICILLNYNKSIELIQEILKSKNLEFYTITGKTDKGSRRLIIEKFQMANNQSRILIGNASVLSTGIDLDDKDGNFPRVALVSPSYNVTNLYQLTKRFKRLDSKSKATINFIYTDSFESEEKILKSFHDKSNVMSNITVKQTLGGEKYLSGNLTIYEKDAIYYIKDLRQSEDWECLICRDSSEDSENTRVFKCQKCYNGVHYNCWGLWTKCNSGNGSITKCVFCQTIN